MLMHNQEEAQAHQRSVPIERCGLERGSLFRNAGKRRLGTAVACGGGGCTDHPQPIQCFSTGYASLLLH
jgi:hypothetical protein